MREGDVLRVKTTGENVVVLMVEEKGVTVRRPLNNPNGIQHEKEYFFFYEVETVEDNVNREFQEIKIRQNLIQQAQAGEPKQVIQ